MVLTVLPPQPFQGFIFYSKPFAGGGQLFNFLIIQLYIPFTIVLYRFNSEAVLGEGQDEEQEDVAQRLEQMNSTSSERGLSLKLAEEEHEQTKRDAESGGKSTEAKAAGKSTMKQQHGCHQRRYSLPETFIRR